MTYLFSIEFSEFHHFLGDFPDDAWTTTGFDDIVGIPNLSELIQLN